MLKHSSSPLRAKLRQRVRWRSFGRGRAAALVAVARRKAARELQAWQRVP